MSLAKSVLNYTPTDARVVAMLDGGGVVIEQADIEYREGRMATVGGHEETTYS